MVELKRNLDLPKCFRFRCGEFTSIQSDFGTRSFGSFVFREWVVWLVTGSLYGVTFYAN